MSILQQVSMDPFNLPNQRGQLTVGQNLRHHPMCQVVVGPSKNCGNFSERMELRMWLLRRYMLELLHSNPQWPCRRPTFLLQLHLDHHLQNLCFLRQSEDQHRARLERTFHRSRPEMCRFHLHCPTSCGQCSGDRTMARRSSDHPGTAKRVPHKVFSVRAVHQSEEHVVSNIQGLQARDVL